MAVSDKKKGLFSEFPPVSTEEWERLIERDLKGADYEKTLIWRSVDGITVRPYFRREDIEGLHLSDGHPGLFPFTRGTKKDTNDWLIRQEIEYIAPGQASAKAMEVLGKGAESVGFVFREPADKSEVLDLLLKMPVDKVCISLSGLDIKMVPGILEDLCSKGKINKDDLRLHWDWDPLGEFSVTGKLWDEKETYDKMARVIRGVRDYPGVKVIGVHGDHFRRAGSKFVQELAFSLALSNEYLAEMDDYDISADEVSERMVFNFAIGSNYFLELSKLRAARMLWARIIESYPGTEKDSSGMYIHAETSRWNKTVYDPYVNMLRTTTEAMSAVLGGVDSMTVHPFDASYKVPDEFSERLARNKQIILKEEAHLNKVVDPGGGSYYIEKLTDSIAAEAWKLFQEVEKRGGYTEAFMTGYIQNEITKSAQMRDENIALRKEILLGINKFPNNDEVLTPAADASIIRTAVPDPTGADTHPLIPYRGAEAFELLRMASERSVKRPQVFLLTIGHPQWRKARADFAAGFFGCGGYKIIANPGFGSLAEGMLSAYGSGSDIIVLCSSDQEYADIAAEAVKINQERSILVVAGYPVEIIDELKKAGIRHFIHVKSNVLDTLRKFNKELGIDHD